MKKGNTLAIILIIAVLLSISLIIVLTIPPPIPRKDDLKFIQEKVQGNCKVKAISYYKLLQKTGYDEDCLGLAVGQIDDISDEHAVVLYKWKNQEYWRLADPSGTLSSGHKLKQIKNFSIRLLMQGDITYQDGGFIEDG